MILEDGILVSLSPHQISSEVGGEVVILDLRSGVYYGLDGVGAEVWLILDAPRSVGEITRIVQEHYQVDRERCALDLAELLTGLAERGLVELSGGGRA